jgi:putative tricarboxylic transport membrane protein
VELLHNIAYGLSISMQPANLWFCFIGVLLGTVVGILPGLGPATTIAMLLPLTFGFSPAASLIMLAGIYYGAQYGGSTTAILINLPGESSSAVTAIDGYQMARQGRAGAALGVAAFGSFFAGTVATIIIAAFAVPLTNFALDFGAAEYFALIVLGLIMSIALAHGSVLKALAMIVLGLVLGVVGTDVYTGTARLTFGILDLADGLNFVAVAVGIFGVAEILRNLQQENDRDVMIDKIARILPSWEDIKASIGPVIRGTAVGSALGILPGGGAVLASFASYTLEKKISRTPERFGKGAIEGVAGPESANNAGAQTSFIPLLTLGIPSNPVMALMVGAMMIQGITPGPSVATDQPALFWGIIASMWIGNLMLVVLNVPLIGLWVKMLKVPYHVMFPTIIAVCSIGVFSVSNNPLDLFAVSFFGLLGFVLVRLRCEPAPLLLGFVLGPMLELYFRRAMILARGDITAMVSRPVTAVLLGLAVIALAIMIIPAVSSKREQVFSES